MAYSEDSFKQEILEILEQLEVRCRRFELYKEKKKGKSGIEIEILVSDIKLTPIFKEIEHLYDVAQYLQNNGLDFFVTFNFDNSLSWYIDSEHPSEESVQIGTIKGESILDIKTKIKELISELSPKEPKKDTIGSEESNASNRRKLRSIHLITESIAVKDVIFLVLDERYEMPIRFDTKNIKGAETAIKKLHNIAYIVDAPGKKVDYSKGTSENINNGPFKRKSIADYMKSNKLKKPTLVQKSEDGKTLVLKNDILIKTMLIKTVPMQYQSLYTDKTK